MYVPANIIWMPVYSNVCAERLRWLFQIPILKVLSDKFNTFFLYFFPEVRMMAEGRFASLPRSLQAHHTLGGGNAHPGVPSTSLGGPGSSTCSPRKLQASLASSMDLLSSRPGWVSAQKVIANQGGLVKGLVPMYTEYKCDAFKVQKLVLISYYFKL